MAPILKMWRGDRVDAVKEPWSLASLLPMVLLLLMATVPLAAPAHAQEKAVESVADPERVGELADQAMAALQAGDFAAAAAAAEPLLVLMRGELAPQDPGLAIYVSFLGMVYRNDGRYAEAEALHREALEITRAALPPGHPDIALSLNQLADLYQAQGRLALAEPLLKEALDIRRTALAAGDPEIGQSLNSLAVLYYRQGRLREAEAHFEEALALRRASLPPHDYTIAESLNNLATLYETQGRLLDAEEMHEEALALLRAALPEGHPNLAFALNNLASLYWGQDRLNEAAPLLEEALAIRRHALAAGHPDLAASLNNLATQYTKEGRLAEAEALYEEALAAFRATLPAEHPDIALGLSNLGMLYQEQGRFEEAERALAEALAIRRKTLPADHPDMATGLNNLAELHRKQGRLDRADPLFEEALRIWRAALPEGHPDLAVALNNIGFLRLSQGRTQSAAAALQDAVAILTNIANRGQVPAVAGTFQLHAEAALRTSLESGGLAWPGAAFQSLQWPSLGAAGEALLAASARRSGGTTYLDDLVRRHEELLAAQEVTRQRYVQALNRPAEHGGTSGLAAIAARYAELKEGLAETQRALSRAFPDYAELALPEPLDLASVQSLLGPEEALVTYLPGRPTIAMLVTRDGYDWAFLPPGEVLIGKARELRCQAALTDPACHAESDDATIRGRGRTAAATRRQQTRQPLDLLDPDEALAPKAFDLALAHELYRDLLGPFEERLAGKTHLIVAPDGQLMGFPFQLLVSDPPAPDLTGDETYRAARWLIRDKAVSVLPTVSSLRALRRLGGDQPRAEQPFLGFGDPVIGRGEAMVCPPREVLVASLDQAGAQQLRNATEVTAEGLFRSGGSAEGIAIASVEAVRALARLPDTRCEVMAVGDALGAEADARYLDEAATESQVKALSRQGRLNDYRVLLFATHGLVAGEAGAAEPGLVLTPPRAGSIEDDGILTASEVSQLKLNADWVILSACNTASGSDPNAESLSGLAKAFFYAGAQSLLVSHWPVYSGSTVELVSETMDRLAADPTLSRAGALRLAMLAFLDPARPDLDPHPAHWAPFSLVGEGGVQ